MKPKYQVAIILVIVIIGVLWFVSAIFAFFFAEASYRRDDFTAGQQKEIAEALGFYIAPGEELSALYQLGVQGEPFFLMITISGIPSEKEFFSRCREEALPYWEYWDYDGSAEFCNYRTEDGTFLPVPKKVTKIVNDQWLFYPVCYIFWGCLIAGPTLITVLIVDAVCKRRKAKKEKSNV